MRKVVKRSGQRLVLEAGAEKKIKVKGLTKIGEWYYYRPAQIDGVRPPRVKLGTRSFAEAVQMALQVKRGRTPEFTPGTLVFEQTRFLKFREGLVKARKLSLFTYESDLSLSRVFRKFVPGETPVVLITRKLVEEWLEALRLKGVKGEKGSSDGTLSSYATRLGVFFGWLVEMGVLKRSPLDGIEVPKVRKTRADRFCTREERERLLEVARREFAEDEDLMLMLMLGFHAGLRLREMGEARRDWLRFWPGGGEIYVRGTDSFRPKDNEERRIPMNRVLREFLVGKKFEGVFLVCPHLGKAEHKYRVRKESPFKRLRKLAGLEWVGWHTLRHTFATLLVQGECPIATVAQWLGDGIEVTYKNYVGYAPVERHVNAGL